MTGGAECVGENDSILDAARRLKELNVGAMPICGEDDRLKGMLTDRDIVVKVLAEGKDPGNTRAGELGEGKPVTIGADDSVDEALRTMTDHKVRRLPVIDGHRLIGIVSQADLATNIDEEKVGDLVEAISAAPCASVRRPLSHLVGFSADSPGGRHGPNPTAGAYWAAMSQENVDLFARGLGAWNDGNLEAIVDMCHPDVRWTFSDRLPDATGEIRGKAAVRNFFTTFTEDWAEISMVADQVIGRRR